MTLGNQAALPANTAACQYHLLLPNKKPRGEPGLIEVCVEKWRTKGPEMCEESGPVVF